MAPRRSAGVLVFRRDREGSLEVLLGHLGGPFWARRNTGAWSVPKGEHDADEEPQHAARREFVEELGLPVPEGAWLDLGEVRQPGGKTVHVWAVEGDVDPALVVPGTFEMEWPPRSGGLQAFPELDRVAWIELAGAAELLITAQQEFLDRLRGALG